ncbi:hypothetical protein BO99DRAFT_374459 [Aspergillus violaceofuscus CBS 115571]|uniref:Zn(2)-C6 fungal-type domain-containing protein n=1 Tax=Aspergillus violaceofuscus (strain CBS 115571) TaxID=1450538 RepID=A0A2V5HIW0_ASPV1|nr:hypothetical protein BO99DRAFT_374459 [Aspergillus violaceofuscus CBS 115571]
MADAEYPYDTRLVSELLRDKRRTRTIRSCFPCRHRKVRCSGQVPCSSCVKRSHPELCRMPTASTPVRPADTESDAQNIPRLPEPEPGAVPAAWNPAAAIARLEAIERQIGELKASFRHIAATAPESYPDSSSSPLVAETSSPAESASRQKAPGQQVVEEATGATIFLGRHADFPSVLGCREPQLAQEQLLQDVMMDDGGVPRAYPFTGLWGPQATGREVCATLPDDEDILRYWQAYQTTAYPFYPVLASIDEFGAALMDFLQRRTPVAAADRSKPDEEPDSSWLALLFAMLACGVQFADDPIQERDLRSRVFLCSSFHCLRLSNFFSQTNLEQIQAMALIGHCLRNNLDTNSAWILMGATMRLAQSIGLHDVPASVPADKKPRWSRLWWTLIQQDCFLSFTYDRPPSALPLTPSSSTTAPPCLAQQDPKGGLTFQASSLRICHLVLTQQPLTTPAQAFTAKEQFLNLQESTAPFLTDKRHCTTLQQHLERLAFQIHLGYVICRMYRLHLDLSAARDPTIVKECMQTAARVVTAFLDLYRLSKAVCRSWAFVHNAVSCAVTLRALGVHHGQADGVGKTGAADELVQRLVGMLQLEATGSEWCDEDTNRRHFGPYSRALRALLEVEGGREGDGAERVGF